MKGSARHYEEAALDAINSAEGSAEGLWLTKAQVYATLAQAAATDDLVQRGVPVEIVGGS